MKKIKKLTLPFKNWWFYLSEENKRVLRFTGNIFLQLIAFVVMMLIVYLLPYLLYLIANYFNIPI